MKRFLTLFLSLILGFSTFSFVGCKNNDNGDNTPPVTPPTPVAPSDCNFYDDNYFAYYLSDDGTYLSVKYFGGDVDELTVPTSYNNIPVTSIKKDAFYYVEIGTLYILDNIIHTETFIFNNCRINKLVIDISDDYNYDNIAERESLMYTGVYIKYLEFTDDTKQVDTRLYYKPAAIGNIGNQRSVRNFIVPKNVERMGTYRQSQ